MPTDYKRIALNKLFDAAVAAIECGCTDQQLEDEISAAFDRVRELDLKAPARDAG